MGKPASFSKFASTIFGQILASTLLFNLLCLFVVIRAEGVPFTTALLPKATILFDSFTLFLRVMLKLAVPSFLALSYHPHFAVFLLLVVVIFLIFLICAGRRITL